MNTKDKLTITVQTTVKAPLEKTWDLWTLPEHVTNWNFASDDWHSPRATNDLRAGGSFNYRMESKDGSMGFDFEGIYDTVKPLELIEYYLADQRKVRITFTSKGNETIVTESFDTENINSAEMQRTGWQSILDNFKTYAENIEN